MPSCETRATELFASGFYCAESVLLALAEHLEMQSEIIPRVATGLCSGLSRRRGPCGALTGAIMGVGLAAGRDTPEETVDAAYALSGKVADVFTRHFGSMYCHDLLGLDVSDPEQRKQAKDTGLIMRKCPAFVGAAARIAQSVLAESGF